MHDERSRGEKFLIDSGYLDTASGEHMSQVVHIKGKWTRTNSLLIHMESLRVNEEFRLLKIRNQTDVRTLLVPAARHSGCKATTK